MVKALDDLAQAAPRGIVIGLENEHACNIATGAESARLLEVVTHEALQLIWDPANALAAGEQDPFPTGYRLLPTRRIVHVHAKDCTMDGHTPVWGPIGEMTIDWRSQIRALVEDGYRGSISLETHWKGSDGNKFEASRTCARILREMIDDAAVLDY